MKPTEAGRLQTAYLATVNQRNGRPAPEAMRALRSFWVDEAADKDLGEAKSDREVRLNAIRQLAQIVAGSGDAAERAAWIDRWRKETDPERGALGALLRRRRRGHAGSRGSDDERARSGTRRSPRPSSGWRCNRGNTSGSAPGSRTSTARRASAIIFSSPSARRSTIREARTDPGMVERALRRGHAPAALAGRDAFRRAQPLSRGDPTRAARVRWQPARSAPPTGWNWPTGTCCSGEADQARAVLRTTISSAAESLDAAGLRRVARILSAAAGGGSAGLRGSLSRRRTPRQPLHAALAGALLHGLAGDEKAAEADLDRLVDMRALSGHAAR